LETLNHFKLGSVDLYNSKGLEGYVRGWSVLVILNHSKLVPFFPIPWLCSIHHHLCNQNDGFQDRIQEMLCVRSTSKRRRCWLHIIYIYIFRFNWHLTTTALVYCISRQKNDMHLSRSSGSRCIAIVYWLQRVSTY
jgi:hypothetical protein